MYASMASNRATIMCVCTHVAWRRVACVLCVRACACACVRVRVRVTVCGCGCVGVGCGCVGVGGRGH
jgi:hypothetical protein